jgi:hypothetical protein
LPDVLQQDSDPYRNEGDDFGPGHSQHQRRHLPDGEEVNSSLRMTMTRILLWVRREMTMKYKVVAFTNPKKGSKGEMISLLLSPEKEKERVSVHIMTKRKENFVW